MVDLLEIIENPSVDHDYIENFSILEELFKQEKLEEGIKQSLAFANLSPERATEFYSWALEFSEATENNDQNLELLEQGLTNGAWWSPDFLKINFVDLMNENKNFDRLLKLADEKTPKMKMKAKLVVRTPTNYDPSKSYPLLLVLHGRGSNNENSDKHWKSEKIRNEMILGLLQSSQLLSSVHCCWDNWDIAFSDIQAAYLTLKTKYAIDEEKSIIGGVSAGAEVALSALFEDVLPINQMISTITSTGRFTENYLEKGKEKKSLKIYFVVGEKDVRYENTTRMHHYFNETSLGSVLHSCLEIGHEIPKDFGKILDKAISYLLKS